MTARIVSLLCVLAANVGVTSGFFFPVCSDRVLRTNPMPPTPQAKENDGETRFSAGQMSRMLGRESSLLLCAHDVTVTLPGGGGVRKVAAEEGQTLLDAFEAHDIEAPHSCRSGLCTECAAMVTANLDNVELEAAVLDPEISARGFVLTCSSTVSGPGVELELGVGDKMYDAQYGEFRQGHDDAQSSKPGKWNLPFPDISGA